MASVATIKSTSPASNIPTCEFLVCGLNAPSTTAAPPFCALILAAMLYTSIVLKATTADLLGKEKKLFFPI